ncbi:MAG TPA: hypothetical protein VGV13_08140 [Methylomirabilota bacterium]|jgi:hypothetical protein|nr:hypothetical protein [Methylomirabilota bacterium]
MGPVIENGSTVRLEYTLKDEAGQEPITYTHGDNQILPALEEALGGPPGRRRQAGHGPSGGGLRVGRSHCGGRSSQGHGPARRAQPRHPLAGKTLHFDVQILEVTPPAP